MIAFRLPSCLGGLFFAFLMLFCSQSWAACYQIQRSATIRSNYYCAASSGTYNFCYPVTDRISVSGQCHCSANTLAPYSYTIELCASTGSRKYATGSCTSSCYEENQSNNSYYFRVQCVQTECDTQAEADSSRCVADGGNWRPGTSTPCSHVVNDTTTMQNLVDHCQNDLEGTPHFRFNDQGNVVGFCSMCDRSGDPDDIYGGYTNPNVQGQIEARREQCCNGGGSIGDNSQFGCDSTSNGCYGANCNWKGSNGGASLFTYPACDLSKPVALGLTCEEYGMGDDSGSGNEEASSSSADTSAAGSSGTAPGDSVGDFEYDYNDSLHKIIDSLGALLSVSRLMLEKMGTGGDTIIVNTERDSVINNVNVEVSAPNVYFNDSVYKSQIGNLENIQGRIKQILSPADTTLQTSLYDTIALSFNKISAQFDSALLFGFKLDSVLFDENLVNVGDYGYQDTVEKYMGTRMAFGEYADSMAHAWGADTISAGFDSSYSYGKCAPSDSACLNGDGEGVGMGDFLGDGDSVVMALGDSLKKNVKNSEDSLPALWSEYWDSTKKYAPYTDFEEKLMGAIGATIPNTNTCPEHCGKFDINLQQLSWVRNTIGIDFGICVPISTFGNINVLLFIRLILRILTIVSCLYITLWEVTTKRGKIGL